MFRYSSVCVCIYNINTTEIHATLIHALLVRSFIVQSFSKCSTIVVYKLNKICTKVCTLYLDSGSVLFNFLFKQFIIVNFVGLNWLKCTIINTKTGTLVICCDATCKFCVVDKPNNYRHMATWVNNGNCCT